MRRRFAVFSLVLVAVLVMVLPGAVMAKQPSEPFSASGIITGIEDTKVGVNAFELGVSGKWLVKDRSINGTLEGAIDSEFTLTYGGIFSIETQAGCLVGTMDAGDRTFFVVGTINPYELVPMGGYDLPKLTISGYWTEKLPRQQGRYQKRSTGTFDAWVIFIPDAQGHVVQIVQSSFEMNGR